MKEIKIEHLAYLLKIARKKGQHQPIFFLGAGASRSGKIPLANEIVSQILDDYSDSPFINDLPKEALTYAKLMECLHPAQRDELLKKYVDEAMINVTHIYLAQLLKEGFVDYILTVNFDNLMLRALALYNIFPATYDMAILKDLTTSSFKEKSVVYLHGQNHGLWLLNTPAEMEKVRNTVPRIFDSIKDRRPWVFIGYSGEDPIFEHIQKLGRFDNGLYWVSYNDNKPNEKVQQFLSDPNTNTFLIKGYDSDSFMLKLNNELGLGQPSIVDKPFTSLKEMLNGIVDIEDKEYFKGVKERLTISKNQVEKAIGQFELGETESSHEAKKNKIDLLKKEIINLMAEEKYDEKIITNIELRAKSIPNNDLTDLLCGLYYNWGSYLGELAEDKEEKEAEELYLQAFQKLQKAIEIEPNDQDSYYAWGTYLGRLAQIKNGKEVEELYLQAFQKFQKAVEIKPDYGNAYSNWGYYLGRLAQIKNGKEVEELYLQAFQKFQKAIEIKPDYNNAYNNWGYYLGRLAQIKEEKEAEELYLLSFQKFQKAIEIKPDHYKAYYNWGTYLGRLAQIKEEKEAEELYLLSFQKFQKAIEIKPDHYSAYDNWGTYLRYLAKIKRGKEAEDLKRDAFEKYQKAFELGEKCYNLACWYAVEGNKKEALFYLDSSLQKKEISTEFVEKDEDWTTYSEDPDFINLLDKYKKA